MVDSLQLIFNMMSILIYPHIPIRFSLFVLVKEAPDISTGLATLNFPCSALLTSKFPIGMRKLLSDQWQCGDFVPITWANNGLQLFLDSLHLQLLSCDVYISGGWWDPFNFINNVLSRFIQGIGAGRIGTVYHVVLGIAINNGFIFSFTDWWYIDVPQWRHMVA